MHITDSTKNITKICKRVDIFVKDTLASSFFLLRALNAQSSRNSLTNALMTAIPEKLSCEKSESSENASCLISHFFIIYFPTRVATISKNTIGIRERSVRSRSICSIFMIAKTPSKSASKNISTPSPKHSCIVSRSFVKRDIRFPTLLVW